MAKTFLSWQLINDLSPMNEVHASPASYIFFSSPVLPWQRKPGSSPLTSRFSASIFVLKPFLHLSISINLCQSISKFSSICLSLLIFINISISNDYHRSIFRDISSISLSVLVCVNHYNLCLKILFNPLSPMSSLWDPSPSGHLQHAFFYYKFSFIDLSLSLLSSSSSPLFIKSSPLISPSPEVIFSKFSPSKSISRRERE